MRSGSTSLILLSAVLLCSCARGAPRLPAADAASRAHFKPLSESEREHRCAVIAEETDTLRGEMLQIEQVLRGRRKREQVAVYLAAVLYPPLLSSMDRHKAQKRALDERQSKIDARLVERKARRCPSAD